MTPMLRPTNARASIRSGAMRNCYAHRVSSGFSPRRARRKNNGTASVMLQSLSMRPQNSPCARSSPWV
eukprot:4846219-Alexandrium_andersonii.AAC.1